MSKDSRMFKDNIQNGLVELATAWELPILSNFIQIPFSESSAQPERKKCHRNSGFNLPARQVPGLDKWMQKPRTECQHRLRKTPSDLCPWMQHFWS